MISKNKTKIHGVNLAPINKGEVRWDIIVVPTSS